MSIGPLARRKYATLRPVLSIQRLEADAIFSQMMVLQMVGQMVGHFSGR